jgi:adenosylcobinamide-GDP ribazoletransferase
MSTAFRTTISTFTIVPAGRIGDLEPRTWRRVVLWLPVLGAVLGVAAAAVQFAVGRADPNHRLLAAVLAVATLALLSGGLHLDGLADTADALASRRPREEALAIMRRSDIGPMGVAALVFVVLADVSALAAQPAGWRAAAALITAVVSGRVAVVLASGLPAARPDGFGALVAASTTRPARMAVLAALLAVVGASAAAASGPALALRALAAVLAGLLAAGLVARAARARLGGMTGDVFGALIEVCTATVLVALAVI